MVVRRLREILLPGHTAKKIVEGISFGKEDHLEWARTIVSKRPGSQVAKKLAEELVNNIEKENVRKFLAEKAEREFLHHVSEHLKKNEEASRRLLDLASEGDVHALKIVARHAYTLAEKVEGHHLERIARHAVNGVEEAKQAILRFLTAYLPMLEKDEVKRPDLVERAIEIILEEVKKGNEHSVDVLSRLLEDPMRSGAHKYVANYLEKDHARALAEAAVKGNKTAESAMFNIAIKKYYPSELKKETARVLVDAYIKTLETEGSKSRNASLLLTSILQHSRFAGKETVSAMVEHLGEEGIKELIEKIENDSERLDVISMLEDHGEGVLSDELRMWLARKRIETYQKKYGRRRA